MSFEYFSYNMSLINDNNFVILWIVGIKLEYCFLSWNIREYRVFMVVFCSLGYVFRVLIMGWIICDVKFVRFSDLLRWLRVFKVYLKL